MNEMSADIIRYMKACLLVQNIDATRTESAFSTAWRVTLRGLLKSGGNKFSFWIRYLSSDSENQRQPIMTHIEITCMSATLTVPPES